MGKKLVKPNNWIFFASNKKKKQDSIVYFVGRVSRVFQDDECCQKYKWSKTSQYEDKDYKYVFTFDQGFFMNVEKRKFLRMCNRVSVKGNTPHLQSPAQLKYIPREIMDLFNNDF